MEKLKRQIIKAFVLCAIGLSVTESMLDSLFDDYLFQITENSVIYKFMIVIYFVLSFFCFLICAVCFYKMAGKKLEEETRKQMREKSLLFANITHDLKTPITSILGFSRALTDHKVKLDRQEEITDIIYKKAKQTNELMNVMLAYSRMEANAYELHFEELDVCVAIRNLLADIYCEFEHKDMKVEINIPETPCLCRYDRKEFSRAFTNILVNVYKHNPEGVHILVEIKKKGKKVFVTVADSGEPIQNELREHIFEPFVCGSKSRNSKEGNGLGLAIAKCIVEKHGGKIWIKDNIPGYVKGFVVELKSM